MLSIYASELDLFAACPGSKGLQDANPERLVRYKSDDAERGIKLHKAVEQIGKTGSCDDAELFQEAMAANELLIETFGPGHWNYESSYENDFLDSRIKIDAWKYDSKTEKLYIVDFKFGKIPTGARRQLISYMYTLCAKLSPRFLIEEATIATIGPNFIYGPNVIHESFCGPEIRHAWMREVVSVVQNARGPNPCLAAGKHCNQCPARINCPEFRDRIEYGIELSKAVAANLPGANDLDSVGMLLTEITSAKDLLESLETALKTVATHAIERDQRVWGWELKPGIGVRGHADSTKSEEVGKLYGVDLYDRKLKSIYQIEKDKILPKEVVKTLEKKIPGRKTLKPVKIEGLKK